jgi:hypothetical protein
MDIVLLGLTQSRLQHLATALEPALKAFAPRTTLYIPQSQTAWTPPSLSSRILLCVNPEDAGNAQTWRAMLLAQGLPFQVIHGIGQELVTQCLLAILPPALQGFARQELPVRWQGVCETCSDPDCEQRLFSGLLQGR